MVDFYVQNVVDMGVRDYTGGLLHRHVNWFSRMFWRAWFDFDRVNLEPARRDYLEYRFGTLLSINCRNWYSGCIPYYLWSGCRKELAIDRNDGLSKIADDDSSPQGIQDLLWSDRIHECKVESSHVRRDILNCLPNSLPLPSYFYQNRPWRFPYANKLERYSRYRGYDKPSWPIANAEIALLAITKEDCILVLTGSGMDPFVAAYAHPYKFNVLDRNSIQNHLLEVEFASYCYPRTGGSGRRSQ